MLVKSPFPTAQDLPAAPLFVEEHGASKRPCFSKLGLGNATKTEEFEARTKEEFLGDIKKYGVYLWQFLGILA